MSVARITESDLHGYVDGALGPSRRAQVERFLAARPEVAEQVEAWRRQNDALAALYGSIVDEPVPPRLDVRRLAGASAASRGIGAWPQLAAAAILCLAVGAAGGWLGRGTLADGAGHATLVDEAVSAHELYASEVLHPVEVRADQQAHLVQWLSRRLDRALAVPDLRPLGFDFIGGRLLPAQGAPAAQLMYEDRAGQRVTFLIVAANDGHESSLRYAQTGSLRSFLWTDESIRCVLVGSMARDRLRDIAALAYRQLG
jgi:anti-sigma factor RsiW